MKASAVGDHLGWTYDERGEPVRVSVQERVTSIQLPRPSRKPVIAFAGGGLKSKAVLGALRGHWVKGSGTREKCGRAVFTAEWNWKMLKGVWERGLGFCGERREGLFVRV